ncbi:MAG: transglutaminaseTgpA domain-containing protein [Thermoleophilaceae bacterium]
MSGLFGRAPAAASAGAAGAPSLDAPTRTGAVLAATPESVLMRLVAFTALAGFAAAHWGAVVAEPPVGRMLLVLLVATCCAAVLGLLARAPLPRAAIHALALIVVVIGFAVGLMAAGLPAKLLLPGHWTELGDGLDRGLSGAQTATWPYEGPETWITLTFLLGAPALLTIAAALAFWPARRAAPVLRFAGLAAVLLLYGTAVAERDPGQPGLRGLVLLVLVAAWLWLPRLGRREAIVAGAVVASVGVLSLPVAAALDSDQPWWDYHDWHWFGGGKVVTFDWNHTYGPLNWSRAGETVLNVKSDRPQYWKAETLDGFDGFRWIRTNDLNDTLYGTQVAYAEPRIEGKWDYGEYNLDWDKRIRFTVRSLSTPFVVGAGVILRVDGVRAQPMDDGTTRLIGTDRLERGDTYSVRAYVPNPTRKQLQGMPKGYSANLSRYTAITLPHPGESVNDELGGTTFAQRQSARQTRESIFVPLRYSDQTEWGPRADRLLRQSVYAPMYDQALRLTRDAPTSYDAVKNVELWLQNNFTYSEHVPTHDVPLMGFLQDDKRGYCQQFSGTMALMLRMAGIPARVAAGFSPGSYNKDTREYRVRDLDAHSWVEVWFTGIGWVPFDPTPARSPAQSQSSALATSAAAADAGEVRLSRQGAAASDRVTDSGGSGGSQGETSRILPGLLLLLVGVPLALGAVMIGVRVARLRLLSPDELAEVQLSELRRALVRLGWELPESTTLLGLERRLGRLAGPRSKAYAGALRANRYDPRAPAGPGLPERRAVRRELSRGGIVERLRGLVAIPPGAPRN